MWPSAISKAIVVGGSGGSETPICIDSAKIPFSKMPFILFRTEPQALLYADIEVGTLTQKSVE